MIEHFIKNYYTFFDTKLQSSTLVVLMICLLISAVGMTSTVNAKAEMLQGNIFQTGYSSQSENIIYIDGVKYLIEVKRIP